MTEKNFRDICLTVWDVLEYARDYDICSITNRFVDDDCRDEEIYERIGNWEDSWEDLRDWLNSINLHYGIMYENEDGEFVDPEDLDYDEVQCLIEELVDCLRETDFFWEDKDYELVVDDDDWEDGCEEYDEQCYEKDTEEEHSECRYYKKPEQKNQAIIFG